jgi:hypothetical protein
MGENMEVSASVVVTDPVSGRMLTVHVTEQEINALLSVGINTLLAQGLIQLGAMDTDEIPEASGLN